MSWVTNGLVASSMVSGGVAQVLQVQASVDGFVRLGDLNPPPDRAEAPRRALDASRAANPKKM